ncbi:MAG: GNAT family N-acetyltransferase [Candidatus Brockarchaeota archaeon]|nr:GNAT family N-acetyltransferase [Candidatus Brockarchaeota archaeon]
MQASGLDPNSDTGQFNYHLGELAKKGMVSKDGGAYRLTQFGFKVAKVLETLEREYCFLVHLVKKDTEMQGYGAKNPPFKIRPYRDGDYENLARLLMDMYNDAWSEMFGPNARMSLEEARRAVVTDLLVPDTRVLVVEQGNDDQLVGFISYAIRHGGVFFVEYEWVENEYVKYGCDGMLFQRVEQEAREAGETSTYIRVSHRERRFIEFLRRMGYETINMLELVKYLDKLPDPYSGKLIEIEGHRFKLR